jgi:hypothetical protein
LLLDKNINLQFSILEIGFFVGNFSCKYRDGKCFYFSVYFIYFYFKDERRFDVEKFCVFFNNFGVDFVRGSCKGDDYFIEIY